MISKPTVTLKDLNLLRIAIEDAEGWRGSLHPDDHEAFDAQIRDMRRALNRVKNDRQDLRRLLIAIEK